MIQVMRADGAARDEPRGEFAERHCRIGLDDLESPIVQFPLKFVLNFISLLTVRSSGGILIPDTVAV